MCKAACDGHCKGECAESNLRDPHLVRVDKTLQRLNVVMSQGEYRVSATEVQGMEESHSVGDSRTALPRSRPSSAPRRMRRKQAHVCN